MTNTGENETAILKESVFAEKYTKIYLAVQTAEYIFKINKSI